MSCERYRTAIIDHACGADLSADAAAHLQSCAACTVLFDEQRHALDAIDRELQQALTIAPSARFVQRVLARTREASSPTPRMLWALAAAAAVVVIGLAAMRWTHDTAIPPTGQVTQAESPAAPAIDPTPAGKAAAPHDADIAKAATHERSTQAATPPRTKPSLPEVEAIVSPEQARAIERYMALIRSGAPLPANPAPATDGGSEPLPLLVPPLSVEPLTVSEAGTGPGTSTSRGEDLL
ncbi:MAG TPA: hypothetical protein VFJ02_09185 [Vicinamibacterales bacterium]|nr:hypothetical protein [Vicinamibacterales bacterium]